MLVLSFLVIPAFLLALLGPLAGRGYLSSGRHLLRGRLQPGAPIVYRMAESSTRLPGPEAKDVQPAERGDLYYYYLIKKYWRVEQVLQDGRIVAVTP